MSRPTISDSEYWAAVKAVPPPIGTQWESDPSASSDRLRLFRNQGGEICVVYPDGVWAVDERGGYNFCARGREVDLHSAMRRALRVAEALGWFE